MTFSILLRNPNWPNTNTKKDHQNTLAKNQIRLHAICNATTILLTTLARPGIMKSPMYEAGKQFSFNRSAPRTSGRAQEQIPIIFN